MAMPWLGAMVGLICYLVISNYRHEIAAKTGWRWLAGRFGTVLGMIAAYFSLVALSAVIIVIVAIFEHHLM